MSEDREALNSFSGTARLFPLPNLVLFPQVLQGLHIFEARYRQMMEDVLETDRLMTLVLLKPGWEKDYDGKPAIETIACLGKVGQFQKLPDGRYNLRLKGISRLKVIEELPSDKLYRLARSELIPEQTPDDLPLLTRLRRTLTDSMYARFPAEGPAQSLQLHDLLTGDTPLGVVCDLLSYALPLPLEMKQQLLAEARVDQRVEILIDALKIRQTKERKFPPDFSIN